MAKSDFSHNPFIRGAYSNQVPGINENHYKALDHPIQQRLHFTGEHHGLDMYGYADIPYEKAMEVAANIKRCMMNEECATDAPIVSSKCTTTSTNGSYSLKLNIFILFYMTFIIYCL